jgi:hypothetical protein
MNIDEAKKIVSIHHYCSSEEDWCGKLRCVQAYAFIDGWNQRGEAQIEMLERLQSLIDEIENCVSYAERHPKNAFLGIPTLKGALADFNAYKDSLNKESLNKSSSGTDGEKK